MRESGDQVTQELLVSLLAEAPDEYLGADALCGKLGLPETVVFRQIDHLRRKGYRIDNRPARGYRLLEVPDRLTSLEISPLLQTAELGRQIHAFDEVDSTNDTARSLAEDGAGHGELVVAESQRAGRGRHGRRWLSEPRKNLTFSLILRPSLPANRAHELTLAAGVAICQVLREAGFDARVKWPNDILVGNRKVGGILAESAADDGAVRHVILGIGLNVNSGTLPAEIAELACSLQALRGEPLPRSFLLASLLESLEGWFDRLGEGPGEMLARCREWSCSLGRVVNVEGPPSFQGTAEAIDDSGALLVRDSAGKLHRVTAGDVGIE